MIAFSRLIVVGDETFPGTSIEEAIFERMA
jgi:hypothetical protein